MSGQQASDSQQRRQPAYRAATRVLGARAVAWALDCLGVALVAYLTSVQLLDYLLIEESRDPLGIAAQMERFTQGLDSDPPPGEVLPEFAEIMVKLWLLVWLPVEICYHTLCEAAFGASPAKALLGLKVVRKSDLAKPDFGAALGRNAFRILDSIILYALGFLTALVSADRQRMGDDAAGTLVVDRRRLPQEPVVQGTAANDTAQKPVSTSHTGSSRPPSATNAAPGSPPSGSGRATPPAGRFPAGALPEEPASWRAGRMAEARVVEELKRLPGEGFYVFSRLVPEDPVGDIDSLVVGPQGLFIVETKGHQGEIRLSEDGTELHRDGAPMPGNNPLAQVLGQANDLRKRVIHGLPGPGHGVTEERCYWLVCFTRASLVEDLRESTDGVCLVGELAWRITAGEAALSEQQVQRLAMAIELAYGKSPDHTPEKPPNDSEA